MRNICSSSAVRGVDKKTSFGNRKGSRFLGQIHLSNFNCPLRLHVARTGEHDAKSPADCKAERYHSLNRQLGPLWLSLLSDGSHPREASLTVHLKDLTHSMAAPLPGSYLIRKCG